MKTNLHRLVLIFLFALWISSCHSNPSAAISQPTPFATVQFYNSEVELGGIQWMESQAIEQGVRLGLNGISAVDQNVAIIFGNVSTSAGTIRSIILRTEDGGKLWKEVMSPVIGSNIQQVISLENGKGWALIVWQVEGPGPVVLYGTTDYGASWTKLSDIPKRGLSYPVRMQFTSENNGQIDMVYDADLPSSNKIAFLTTADGGMTWLETGRYVPGSGNLVDMATAVAPYLESRALNYKSIGNDGSEWKLEIGDFETQQLSISRQLPKENNWMVVSMLPKHLQYVDGQIMLP